MIGKERQSVADLAVERCGSVESLCNMARVNHLSVDSEVAGIDVAEAEVRDANVVAYFAANSIVPAMWYKEDETEHQQQCLTTDNGDVLTTDNGEILEI